MAAILDFITSAAVNLPETDLFVVFVVGSVFSAVTGISLMIIRGRR